MRAPIPSRPWWGVLGLSSIAAVAWAASREEAAPPKPAEALVIAEPIYTGGLQGDWQDYGWAPRGKRAKGEPERLDLSEHGGWILAHPRLEGIYGGLVFRFRGEGLDAQALQVKLDSTTVDIFPRVKLDDSHVKAVDGGWTQVFVPMTQLNPTFAVFDRVVLRAWRRVPFARRIEIDGIGLTKPDAATLKAAVEGTELPGTAAEFDVDCTRGVTRISPLIYGIAYSPMREWESDHQWKLGATARRWGGNPASRYNWELGNAWNAGADYFFRNLDYTSKPGFTWDTFLVQDLENQVQTALTVPMIGWVARDTKSASFPVDELGAQQQTDPDRPNFGNGLAKNGKPIAALEPKRTSVPATPEFVERWVRAIRAKDEKRGRSVASYILDNEPALWNDTHRDVHPEPLGYDELLKRTLEYGSAVRRADPEGLIAGPAEWGWPGYLYSAIDAKAGFGVRPDRRAHGDVPLIPWYLKRLAEEEEKTGVHLLDVLDLHFYPQGKGIGVGTDGNTDPETNARRIRSTRALWDPTYADESWIGEPVQLIPRMQRWVDENHPGLKLSIGEYSFGAERHLSGGLALAEALGRFGQQHLYSAYYWTYPPEGSPAFWAFRAFRNYDGQGGHFLDWSLPVRSPADTSAFASVDEARRRMTLVLLNFSNKETFDAQVLLQSCGGVEARRMFSYTGDPKGLRERPIGANQTFKLPPYSISVVQLTLVPREKKTKPQ